MNISTGWREQYDRMQRSYEHLVAVSRGEHPDALSSDTAHDVLYHFFQDAYHLKDWIAATMPAIRGQIEERIKDSKPLCLCADLCNGTKHLRLDPRRKLRTGDHATAFTAQDVTVRPAAAGSGQPPRPALHAWHFTSQRETRDALTLAGEVINEWNSVLHDLGLIQRSTRAPHWTLSV
jgi:hypothetical protein